MQPFPITFLASGSSLEGFSNTVIDDTSIGTVAWTNTTNAQGNQTTLFASWISGGNNITSHYLNAQNFGFNIPLTATIKGIQLSINRRNPSGLGTTKDSVVSLIKSGVISGNNRAIAPSWNSTQQYINYGSSTDLWGQPWLPTDINDPTFGAAIAVLGTTKLAQASIYAFRITVSYI